MLRDREHILRRAKSLPKEATRALEKTVKWTREKLFELEEKVEKDEIEQTGAQKVNKRKSDNKKVEKKRDGKKTPRKSQEGGTPDTDGEMQQSTLVSSPSRRQHTKSPEPQDELADHGHPNERPEPESISNIHGAYEPFINPTNPDGVRTEEPPLPPYNSFFATPSPIPSPQTHPTTLSDLVPELPYLPEPESASNTPERVSTYADTNGMNFLTMPRLTGAYLNEWDDSDDDEDDHKENEVDPALDTQDTDVEADDADGVDTSVSHSAQPFATRWGQLVGSVKNRFTSVFLRE
jgi:hypothetical protein